MSRIWGKSFFKSTLPFLNLWSSYIWALIFSEEVFVGKVFEVVAVQGLEPRTLRI